MRRTARPFVLSAAVLAAHQLGACAETASTSECVVSRDCPGGWFCIGGTCRAPAEAGTDADADVLAEDVELPEADVPLPDAEVVAPEVDVPVETEDAPIHDDSGPACGNGVLEPGEACDDGPGNSDVVPDACRTDCRRPRCGDGVVDSGESCDDGVYNGMPGYCVADCSGRGVGCGDGSEGDFVAFGDTSLPAGRHQFRSFTIAAGAQVTVVPVGDAPLELDVRGPVRIDGRLELSGSRGADSGPGSRPNGGNAGPGGGGGGGGGDCGNGAGSGGYPRGGDGGPAGAPGGNGGTARYATVPPAYGGAFGPGGGGGGGGHATAGQDGERVEGIYGTGGQPYGDAALSVLQGGGGGGGGGANGGGGGGGGGAVRVFAASISVAGVIRADGGAGGVKISGWCTSGAGGGGAGGTVWLSAPTITVTGSVTARGGAGGPEGGATDQYGGAGAPGRIRIDSPAFTAPGTVDPLPGVVHTSVAACP